MDDRRLTELFQDAATLPRTAAFTVEDVRAAARRETRRHRARLAAGGALAAVVLVGAGVVGGQVLLSDDGETVASAPAAGQAAERAAEPPPPVAAPAPSAAAVPEAAPVDGPCGPVDSELAGALVAALAERGATPDGPAEPFAQECAAGTRAATVPVDGGVLSVLLVPAGESPPVARPGITSSRSVDGGGALAVQSVAGRGSDPPLAGEVRDLARELAADF